MLRKLAVICLVGLVSGCATKTSAPQLTPTARAEFNLTRLVDALGTLQLAAENATKTYDKEGKPILSVNSGRSIVQFTVGANKTIGQTPNGWFASVNTAYQEAKKSLSQEELTKFSSWLNTFELVLTSFGGQ